MKPNNNSNQQDNDLKFTPLSIQEPLKLNNFTAPLINGPAPSGGMGFMCFPTPLSNLPMQDINKPYNTNLAPLTPYPKNIPTIEKTQINPSTNNNLNTNTNTNNTNNFNNNLSNNSSNSLEFPSELNADDLYSYNKPRVNDNYLSDSINPLDILRNFIIEDTRILDRFRDSYNQNDIDDIFKKIEDNNSVVLSTMKAYRIPYPIAKLLIKNIIKLTLEYKGR